MRVVPGAVPNSAPRQSTPGDNKDRFGLAERELTASFIDAPPVAVIARPGVVAATAPVTETVYVPTATGVATPGPKGDTGPSDRFSDVAILVDSTPFNYAPDNANPVVLWVYVGASGDAAVVNINAGAMSAGKKILVVNGQRGGHKNIVDVVCNPGSVYELTDTLVDGSDALEAVILAFPAGGASSIPVTSATPGTGTTTIMQGGGAMTDPAATAPAPAQLRVQVVSTPYRAEGSDSMTADGRLIRSGTELAHG